MNNMCSVSPAIAVLNLSKISINYFAIRDEGELNELVTFIVGSLSAVYQVPKEGVLCMKQARVWKTLRQSKGLDAEG